MGKKKLYESDEKKVGNKKRNLNPAGSVLY